MGVTEFVESYFDAWNHRDPKAVADHLAADGIYCDIPENVQRSHDELIISLNDFFSTFRHRYELIGEILTSRDTVAFQYRMYPLGKVNEGKSAGSFHGAEFMTMHGDAAMTITDYYDIPGTSPTSHLTRLTPRNAQKLKYAKSGLRGQQLLEYKDRLEQIMRSQQTYLRPDLTLPKLAGAVDCSVNHLSQVINSGFGMSFFDYLNQHRIEHARELLTKLDGQSDAVLNIAFTVGFNSNSAFYAAFKKCVGQTPAQYRRSQLNKAH
ncbi:MAG: helix-turn-helix domain-containing protein, partial [Gammaproteobacteria bacterium]|nr:helix-turn-helix domain-containing protein [Gammaproteobacteria bacterium]